MKICIFLLGFMLFANVQSSIFLDEEMQDMVDEVREKLERKASSNQDLKEWLDKNSDGIIANWVINSEKDLNKAETGISAHVKWRKANDLDNAKNWEYTDEENEKMPFAITGHDEHGDVVVLMPFGKWKVRELLGKGVSSSKINKQILRTWEWGMQTPDPKTGILPDNMVFLVDLHDFSLAQVTSIRSIAVAVQGGIGYMTRFPMYSKRTFLFGDPPYFQIMWRAVEAVLPKRALDRLTLHGTKEESWKKAIFEWCPSRTVPTYRGGEAIVNFKTHGNDLDSEE